MIRKAAGLLRANETLRAVARAGFWGAEWVKVSLLGTQYHERHWRHRHAHKGSDWDTGGTWIAGYWESRHHSHRSGLIQRVLAYSPASLIEFGCNCGPNLSLLHDRDPSLRLTGVDINPEAIEKGRDLLAADACAVKLVLGGIDKLASFPDDSFDVFLTDAVLMYVAPDRIGHVLAEAIRLSRIAVVMLEWHTSEATSTRRGGDVFVRGHWVRDYRNHLEDLVEGQRVRVTRIQPDVWPGPEWPRWGHWIEVDLRGVDHSVEEG